MPATQAWKRHGCYGLGSEQYYNFPLEKAAIGCYDDWNALDHFDPTADVRRLFAQFMTIRRLYGAVQDGFDLVQRGNWTYTIERPGSDGVPTEMGLWSVSRSAMTHVQNLTGTYTDQVWMLYTNENATNTWTYDCKKSLWISSPYQSGTTVQNLFYPYETYTLQDSLSSFFNDTKPPYFGCLPSVTMDGFGFKALVPVAQWTAPLPALTKFVPGHDHRILVNSSDTNATTVDISLEFNTAMSCSSVTDSMSFNLSSSGKGGNISVGNVNCGNVTNKDTPRFSGGSVSVWAWSATLSNFADGILSITIDNPQSAAGNKTGVSISLDLRHLVRQTHRSFSGCGQAFAEEGRSE